jgi:hypothetical protein
MARKGKVVRLRARDENDAVLDLYKFVGTRKVPSVNTQRGLWRTMLVCRHSAASAPSQTHDDNPAGGVANIFQVSLHSRVEHQV